MSRLHAWLSIQIDFLQVQFLGVRVYDWLLIVGAIVAAYLLWKLAEVIIDATVGDDR